MATPAPSDTNVLTGLPGMPAYFGDAVFRLSCPVGHGDFFIATSQFTGIGCQGCASAKSNETAAKNIDVVRGALSTFLSSDSIESRRIRSLFHSDSDGILQNLAVLELLSCAVSGSLGLSMASKPASPQSNTPTSNPSGEPVCMHVHGFIPQEEEDIFEVHRADNGPAYSFSVIYDADLTPDAMKNYYDAGLMVAPTKKLTTIRSFPYGVAYYAIVEGKYRGVRLCSISSIRKIGFEPHYPCVHDPFPVCRSCYTPHEAFAYLHAAMRHRGLLVARAEPEDIKSHPYQQNTLPSASQDHISVPDSPPPLPFSPLTTPPPLPPSPAITVHTESDDSEESRAHVQDLVDSFSNAADGLGHLSGDYDLSSTGDVDMIYDFELDEEN